MEEVGKKSSLSAFWPGLQLDKNAYKMHIQRMRRGQVNPLSDPSAVTFGAASKGRLAMTTAHRIREAEGSRDLATSLSIEVKVRKQEKELRCLYGLGKLIEGCGCSLECLMDRVVDLHPPAWQYPEIASAKICYYGKQYTSGRYKRGGWKQSSAIEARGKRVGSVEVCYLRKMPLAEEGPFLKSERALIDAVAERLGCAAERSLAHTELREAHAKVKEEHAAAVNANAALRGIIGVIEEQKKTIERAVALNVEKVIMPAVLALEARANAGQKVLIRLLKASLEDISSPLVSRLSRKGLALTPAEITVCDLIKKGLSTKEIARLRGTAPGTVTRQRETIRRKLGLAGRDRNLQAFLCEYDESF